MIRWVLSITAALAISGCKKEAAEPPAAHPPAQPAAAPTPAAGPSKAAAPAKPARSPKPAKPRAPEATAEQKAAVDTFLAAWVKTQTDGNFAAYSALYADPFRGVRRSGPRTVKLDRAGWMKDRGRMFKKKMMVLAEHPVLRPTGKHIEVIFKQTWESGAYRDEGFKKMVLTPKDASFLIAREEMLESRLLPTVEVQASGTLTLGLASRKNELQLATLDGADVLLARIGEDISTGDMQVLDTVTDPAGGNIVAASASRAVDPAEIPPVLQKAKGMKVNVLDLGFSFLCQGNLGDYTLHARGWTDGGHSAEEAAAAVWKEGTYVVRSHLLAPDDCVKKAAWVRDASLPEIVPATGTYDDARDPLEKAARADLAAGEGDEVSIDFAPLPKDEWVVFAGVHTPDSCETEERYTWTAWRATMQDKAWELTRLADGEADDTLLDALDLDGDGAPEVITTRGLVKNGKYEAWTPDLAVYWPAGLGCDGCDGPECYPEAGE